jgi:hypothetical protein
MLGTILKASSSAVPPGQETYTTAGTFDFVVPLGVTSISAVAIGAGQGARNVNQVTGVGRTGGNGGNLVYSNGIQVVPTETLRVVVSAGSNPVIWSSNLIVPPACTITRLSDSSVLLAAQNRAGSPNIGTVVFLGGSPGTISGGPFGVTTYVGGGAASFTANGSDTTGSGTNIVDPNAAAVSRSGLTPGIHGGGGSVTANDGTAGARGAVRIIWGDGRAYPNTNVLDV